MRINTTVSNGALEQGISVEALISDLIEDDNAWQQSLANDAMASLFGQIEDALDPAKIDAILYSPRS